jgi:hypothetical protein
MTVAIKQILIVICLAVLADGICKAQSSDSQTITNWGESVHGVRLSIALTNNVIDVGSTTLVSATIQNLSTNIVRFKTS